MIEMFSIFFQIIQAQSKEPYMFYTAKNARLNASCGLVDSNGLMQFANKPVDFIKLRQVCEHQTCSNLIFADLQSSLHAAPNLQQVC